MLQDNIFAEYPAGSSVDMAGFSGTVSSAEAPRLRKASEAVLNKVEEQQSRWFAKVHEQRKKIYTDHTMLN